MGLQNRNSSIKYWEKQEQEQLPTLKSLSSALLISRYILGLGQHERCCFFAACPNRKMYLEIRNANEGALKLKKNYGSFTDSDT